MLKIAKEESTPATEMVEEFSVQGGHLMCRNFVRNLPTEAKPEVSVALGTTRRNVEQVAMLGAGYM